MNACGRDCTLIIRIGNRILNLPYSAETLRDEPDLAVHEALIDAERPELQLAGFKATGCLVTPLTITNVPPLLAFAFAHEEEPEWLSGTRNLHSHELTHTYGEDGASAEILQLRVHTRRRYERLGCAGYELRGSGAEALQLRIDLRGERGGEEVRDYQAPPLLGEEYFRMENTAFRIDLSPCSGIYAFSLTVEKEDRKAELRLHATLDETNAMLLGNRIGTLEMTSILSRDAYEEREAGRFSISAEDLIQLSDETVIDAADEVIGPRRYLIRGTLTATVYSAEGGRLLL